MRIELLDIINNQPPYFETDLKDVNVTFDSTTPSTQVFRYTSPLAIDPEGQQIRMSFYFSNAAGALLPTDAMMIAQNTDNTFSLEIFPSASEGIYVIVVTLSDGFKSQNHKFEVSVSKLVNSTSLL
jgi:hypothetical protein